MANYKTYGINTDNVYRGEDFVPVEPGVYTKIKRQSEDFSFIRENIEALIEDKIEKSNKRREEY